MTARRNSSSREPRSGASAQPRRRSFADPGPTKRAAEPRRRSFGLTWWGQRWIAALEALGSRYANRLPRGRTYARKGAVSDLRIEPGVVTAKVHGSRATPYRVTLRLRTFSDDTWDTVIAALADAVAHAAALLDGQMPESIDETLADCGVSLFPRSGELTTRCSCPDVANPCKHVAAVHYLLAETFDTDPFLLPTLRGRDRAALLAGLRSARAGGVPDDDEAAAGGEPLLVDDLHAATLWDAPGDLGAIAVRPVPSPDPVAVLRRLGPPPGVLGAGDAEFLCEDVVARAADLAWRLAAGGAGAPDADAMPGDPRAGSQAPDVSRPDASGWDGPRGRSSPDRPR
jgi:uncharacterized Zn finger protein